MASPYDLAADVEDDVLAWDKINQDGSGPQHQPWRQFWPPKDVDQLAPEELEAKPWLTWKRDPKQPNEKPWYHWCNIWEGEVDLPCQNTSEGRDCPHCDGKGCNVCSTVAEGG